MPGIFGSNQINRFEYFNSPDSHIIKVTDKKEAGEAKFDEVKPRIVDYLKNEKTQKAISDYIAQLKEKAKIVKMAK